MSLQNGRCDRCGAETGFLTGSYFNTDMVCLACDREERASDRFAEAQRAENEAVRQGDFNFRGIGR
jgi:hypothetical protein